MGGDLWKVVSRAAVLKADEDANGGNAAGNNLNENLDTRAKEAVRMQVAQVRAAIQNGGRIPLSVEEDCVPPEGEIHTLVLAAYQLCLPIPNLLAIILADGGVVSPIGRMWKDANDWLESIRKGGTVTPPTDPTGEDYATAPSDDNAEIQPIRWGDDQGTSVDGDAGAIDMSTDGPWNSSEAT